MIKDMVLGGLLVLLWHTTSIMQLYKAENLANIVNFNNATDAEICLMHNPNYTSQQCGLVNAADYYTTYDKYFVKFLEIIS